MEEEKDDRVCVCAEICAQNRNGVLFADALGRRGGKGRRERRKRRDKNLLIYDTSRMHLDSCDPKMTRSRGGGRGSSLT